MLSPVQWGPKSQPCCRLLRAWGKAAREKVTRPGASGFSSPESKNGAQCSELGCRARPDPATREGDQLVTGDLGKVAWHGRQGDRMEEVGVPPAVTCQTGPPDTYSGCERGLHLELAELFVIWGTG